MYHGHFGGESSKTPARTDTLIADYAEVYRDFLDRVGLKRQMQGGTIRKAGAGPGIPPTAASSTRYLTASLTEPRSN